MTDRPAEEMLASACAALGGRRYTLADAPAIVPDGTGLYALYGGPESWQQLGLVRPAKELALHVGKAEDSLVTRTAQSTVRQTLAALLRDELGLRGLPRNQTKPERLADYALSEEHEVLLTTWMNTHLEVAVWAKPPECEVLGDLEVAVLKRWSPPLNLRDARSTAGARVSAARKVMTSDARTWAREHGHKIG